MLRVGSTNLLRSEQTAYSGLQGATRSLNEATERLATMRRLNRGADDPAGLIEAEMLRAELTALNEFAEATEQAERITAVAESGLDQASELLRRVQGHVVTAASSTTSDVEREALQLEVDASLEALDRLGYQTNFGGQPLLDGSASVALQNWGELQLPQVHSGQLGSDDGTLNDLRSGSAASLKNDPVRAAAIVNGALSQLVSTRVQIGNFQRNVTEPARQITEANVQNLSAAYQRVADTDVAEETSRLTRAMILRDFSLLNVREATRTRQVALSLLGKAKE